MASASDVYGQEGARLLSERLSCAICFEVYKSPRALSCLHTFCEVCLQSYIAQGGEFEDESRSTNICCPVCRRPTKCPDPSKPVSEWASLFPVNYALQSALEPVEVRHEDNIQCDSCAGHRLIKPAEAFCVTCRESLCSDCVQCHSQISVLRNHVLKSLQEVRVSQAEPRPFPTALAEFRVCPVHADKAVEFYCNSHDAVCCSTCAVFTHRGCEEVIEIVHFKHEGVHVEKAKQLFSEMDTLVTELGSLSTTLLARKTSVESQSYALREKVDDYRATIVDRIEQTVSQLMKECDIMSNSHSSKLTDKITQLRSLTGTMAVSRTLLASILENASKTERFTVYHKLKQQLRSCQETIEAAKELCPEMELHLDLDKQWEAVLTPGLPQSLGRVVLRRTQIPLEDCSTERMEPVTIERRWQLEQPCFAGIAVLSNGRLVATDRRNNLCCVLDHCGKVLADLRLSAEPSNLVATRESEVCVAIPSLKEIKCIRIEDTMSVTRTIECKRKPICLALFCDNTLAVGYDDGVGLIRLDGNEQRYVEISGEDMNLAFETYDRIVVNKDSSRIYHSNSTTNTVNCFDLDGHVYFKYKPSGNQATRGVTLDQDGNLYVCCRQPGNIHQVSRDGQLISVIDTDLEHPYSISFNSEGKMMVVADSFSIQSFQYQCITFAQK